MAYRLFAAPQPTPVSDNDWIEWIGSEAAAHPIVQLPGLSCELCCGSVEEGDDFCYPCRRFYGPEVGAVIPIATSFTDGVESMIKQFKDGQEQDRWLVRPLSAMVRQFLAGHFDCIRSRYGTPDLVVTVPNNNVYRTFDHVRDIVDGFDAAPMDPGVLLRDHNVRKPERQQVKPSAYVVKSDLSGRVVLLIDDLWTSGGTSASAAAALKSAGAASVICLVVGRQQNLHGSFGTTKDLIGVTRDRTWSPGVCVLCATVRAAA